MLDWSLETGLYLLGIALIPAAGAVLVCWGLWGDRSKGRSRCPKCWYDMRGSLPRLECPECGHAPGNARGLYRNHRRWGRIVVGIVLVLLSGYPLAVVGGWYREQSSIGKLTQRGHWVSNPTRTGPDWLVGRLPEGFARLFDRAGAADLGQVATDGDLAECAKLGYLQRLNLSRTQVTDAGVAKLEQALLNVIVPR